MTSAAKLAAALDGHRQGQNWRCSCPLNCGYTLSLCDGDDGRLLAYCFGGCEFSDIAAALVQYGLLDDGDYVVDTPQLVEPENATAEELARRIERARQIYQQAMPAAGTPVEAYWRSRNIALPVPGVIRFHPRCPHRLGICLPAKIAP